LSTQLFKIRGQIPRKVGPLYFQQLNQEYKTAMSEIEVILNRQDLNPENLVKVIEGVVAGNS